MRKKERVAPNLYIVTRDNGKRFYIVRFMLNGKAIERSLGQVEKISLRSARAKAGAIMASPPEGKPERKKALTFQECAEQAFANFQAIGKWRNGNLALRWWGRLALHALPFLGAMPIDDVSREDCLQILKPIWLEKTATAKELRQSISAIFDFAIVQGFRDDNPATWKSNLEFFLPKAASIHETKHHTAPSIEELQKAVPVLIKSKAICSGLLLFIMATVSRFGECNQATASQIQDEVWTVPKEAQKAATEPRKVPLSELAIIALTKPKPFGHSESLALKNLKAVIGRGVTIHGIRSTFRDWCAAEGEDFETAERCLSHQTTTKVQRAYLRRDYFEERKALLQKWSNVLLTNVKD